MVVRLEPTVMIGGMVISPLAGWAADRYGGRRVTLVGVLAAATLPVIWLLIPHHSRLSTPLAFWAAFCQGLLGIAVSIATTRLFFSELIPPRRRMNYSAVNYAACGLIGGIGPILTGFMLTQLKGLNLNVAGLTVHQYTPLFMASLVLILAGAVCFARIGRAPVGEGQPENETPGRP
jgi:MFS family permease